MNDFADSNPNNILKIEDLVSKATEKEPDKKKINLKDLGVTPETFTKNSFKFSPFSTDLLKDNAAYLTDSNVLGDNFLTKASTQDLVDYSVNTIKGGGLNLLAGILMGMDYDVPGAVDLWNGVDRQYGSEISKAAEKLREKAQKDYPIYQTGTSLVNPAYWFNQFKESFFSLGLMLESFGEGAIISTLTGGFGAEAEIVNIGRKMKKMLAISAGIGALKGVQEAYLNAKDTLKQTAEKFEQLGYSKKEAYKKGIEAASLGFKLESVPLTIINAMQYALLAKSSASIFSKGKSLDLGFSSLVPEMKYIPAFITQSGGESLEEGIQQFISSYSTKTILSNYNELYTDWTPFDTELRDNMIGGALMGGVFHLVGTGLARITGRNLFKEQGKKYDAYVKSIGSIVEGDLKKIEKAKKEGRDTDAEVLAINNTIDSTMSAIAFDFKNKDNKAYTTFIGHLNKINKAVQENDEQLLKEYKIEKDSELYNSIKQNYPELIKQAEEIRNNFITNYLETGNFSISATLAKSEALRDSFNLKAQELYNTIVNDTETQLKKLIKKGEIVKEDDITHTVNSTLIKSLELLLKMNKDENSAKYYKFKLNELKKEKEKLEKPNKKAAVSFGNILKGMLYLQYARLYDFENQRIKYWKDRNNQEEAVKYYKQKNEVENTNTEEELQKLIKRTDENYVKEKAKAKLDEIKAKNVENKKEYKKPKSKKEALENLNKNFELFERMFPEAAQKQKEQEKQKEQKNKEVQKNENKQKNEEITEDSLYGKDAFFNPKLDDFNSIYDKILKYFKIYENTNNPTLDQFTNLLNDLNIKNEKVKQDLIEHHKKNKASRYLKELEDSINKYKVEETDEVNIEPEGNEIKGYKTDDGNLKLAFLNLDYTLDVHYDEEGNSTYVKTDSGEDLNIDKINTKILLDSDKIDNGTVLTVRIPDNVNDYYITLWEDLELGIKGESIKFGEWKKDKTEEEIRKKIPLVVYFKNEPIAFIHDEQWYNPHNVALKNQSSTIKEGRDNIRQLREAFFNNDEYLNIVVTDKSVGKLSFYNDDVKLTDNKREDQVKLIYVNNLKEVRRLKDGSIVNEVVHLLKNPDGEIVTGILELRKTNNKNEYIATRVFKKSISDSEDVFNTLTALLKAKYEEDSDAAKVFKKHGFDINKDFNRLFKLFINDNPDNIILEEIEDVNDDFSILLFLADYQNDDYYPEGLPFVYSLKGKIYFGRNMNLNDKVENSKIISERINELLKDSVPIPDILDILYKEFNLGVVDSNLGIDNFIDFLKTGKEVSYEGRSYNTKLVLNVSKKNDINIPIFDSEEKHIRTQNYYSLIKNNLYTANRSFNIGTNDNPKYVSTIQPVINFLIKNDEIEEEEIQENSNEKIDEIDIEKLNIEKKPVLVTNVETEESTNTDNETETSFESIKEWSNNRTESENVKIVPVDEINKTAKEQSESGSKNKIIAFRVDKNKSLLQNFKESNAIGNPFNFLINDEEGKREIYARAEKGNGEIIVRTYENNKPVVRKLNINKDKDSLLIYLVNPNFYFYDNKATEKFYDWLVGNNYQDIEQEYRKAILDAIKGIPIKIPNKTINIYWSQKETEKNTRILSNLAPRPFTYKGIKYGSVEHAYQTLKSGKFDEDTYNKYIEKYKKDSKWGGKIRGKSVKEDFDNLSLMKELVIESFKQNPYSEAADKLLQYSDFTHNTNTVIDKAFLEGLKLAQNELLKIRDNSLKGKEILYYKELKRPSHATVLDYLINKSDSEQFNIEDTNKDDILYQEAISNIYQDDNGKWGSYIEYPLTQYEIEKGYTERGLKEEWVGIDSKEELIDLINEYFDIKTNIKDINEIKNTEINLQEKNIFTVTPIKLVDKKAKSKAKIATKYIGFAEGIPNSSTALYAKQAGEYANVGEYNEDDVVFVSIVGKRGNIKIRKEQQDKTIKEAVKALESGATILTDNKEYIDSSSYNEGEKRLKSELEKRGYNYFETTVDNNKIGVWSKNDLLNKTTSNQTNINTSEDENIKELTEQEIIDNYLTPFQRKMLNLFKGKYPDIKINIVYDKQNMFIEATSNGKIVFNQKVNKDINNINRNRVSENIYDKLLDVENELKELYEYKINKDSVIYTNEKGDICA